jgi:hypothetical protein
MSAKRMLVFVCALCLVGLAVSFAFARKWTDSTGKYSVEADFVDFNDGKVTLKKENGGTLSISIDKLSQADQEYVKSQVPTQVRNGGEKQETVRKKPYGNAKPADAKNSVQRVEEDAKKYEKMGKVGEFLMMLRLFSEVQNARKEQDEVEMKALGILPMGESRKAEVKVSDNLVVTDVPVDFLTGRVTSATVHLGAMGEIEKDADAPNRAKAVVRWWFYSTPAGFARTLGEKKEKIEPAHVAAADSGKALGPGISTDAQQLLLLKLQPYVPGKAGAAVSTDWLFPSNVLKPGFTPNSYVSFRALLERFEPELRVTDENSDLVAEEVIWTGALGLSDGTVKTLPDARRRVQAYLLETIGFQIGDPADREVSKREAAQKKLNDAKRTFVDLWQNAQKKE